MKAIHRACLMFFPALLAGAVMAGDVVHESKMKFKLKTGDAEMIEADVSDLAVGESETFVTESGRTVDLLRTQDGMEVYLDGELIEMDIGDEVVHGKHVIVHSADEVECFSDEEGDCVHDNVFIMAGDDSEGHDGDHVMVISKHIEVVCDDDEECEENIWISEDDDIHVEELHDEDGHKVIKKRVIKDTSSQD